MAADHNQTGKPNRTLVRPAGKSLEEMYEAAVEMFRVITGREPTEEEIAELDEYVKQKKAKSTEGS